jgi:uncharacterized YigZ family protein
MSPDSFLTLVRQDQAELKVKRSRFIATAIPAASVEMAENAYREHVRSYHDATHNCYAYLVGLGSEQQFRYSDDGEPSGTAGRSILDAIYSFELTNLLVIVTRYFGGVKLGTGGLARAYRNSANLVLEQAEKVVALIKQQFQLAFPHDQISIVMKTLADFELKPLETDYSEHVLMRAEIRQSRYDEFRREIRDRSRGKVEIAEV